MNYLFPLMCLGLLVYVNANECSATFKEFCSGDVSGKADMKHCSAKYGNPLEGSLINYAMMHLQLSYDYLLMATHMGSYTMNRKGFEKLYNELSDEAWEDTIKLLKHVHKRGGKVTKIGQFNSPLQKNPNYEVELHELDSLARSLDAQKTIAVHGLDIVKKDLTLEKHDGEIIQFLEENFLSKHPETVRKLSGHVHDMKKFTEDSNRFNLAVEIFDNYLAK